MRRPKPVKPEKPYAGFPLTAHPQGQWCKKICGRVFYFGRWEDPVAALTKYESQKECLHNGEVPIETDDSAVVVLSIIGTVPAVNAAVQRLAAKPYRKRKKS